MQWPERPRLPVQTLVATVFAVFIVTITTANVSWAQTAAADNAASTQVAATDITRSLVHVLDYMAADYAVAVEDGRIVNAAEYEEMQNFALSAARLLEDLSKTGVLKSPAAFQRRVALLSEQVDAKAHPDSVAASARALRNHLLTETNLLSAPRAWPDLARGADIYAVLCASCHGAAGGGDGPGAAGLDPAPTVFDSGERIAALSPFQAYNTIRLGVDGTSMASYGHLSDEEIWDLAFFVKSLAADSMREAAVGPTEPDEPTVPDSLLPDVAMLGDPALRDTLRSRGVANAGEFVTALRTHQPADRTNPSRSNAALDRAEAQLDSALMAYAAGQTSDARQFALGSYLEGIEPVEPAIGARDGTLLIEIEARMMAVRNAIENDEGTEALAEAVDRARASIGSARTVLASDTGGFWFSFLVAASILLREGLEAFLIILAILGVLHAAGQQRAARWVHGGWIAALAVGIVGWFVSDLLLGFEAAQREIMEGAIALFAVAVLLYMGLWMHSMTASRRWQAFIEERIMLKLSTGSMIGLAALAFFAVFREAFESVLFLSALSLEAGDESGHAVIGGALSAILLIFAVAPLALKRSRKLPIREVFRYSSFVLGFLCIVLAGKGIHALQEAGLVSVTVLRTSLRFDLVGMYPSLETMLAQVVVLVALVIGMIAPRWLFRT